MALKLTQLASKPQLIKITLDTPEIKETYGDELEFWIMDRQPIDQFIKMATLRDDNQGEMIRMVNDLVLDEEGKKVLGEGEALPGQVLIAVIAAVVDRLGK
jgi:outer membrane lipoprotein-sorting protein